jgi:hypothetical protein
LEQEIVIPEHVWILDRTTYRGLLTEESREEFAKLPSISTNAELQSVFRDAIGSTWPGFGIRVESTFYSENPVRASAVDSITRTIMETFRYVAVFGVREALGFVAINGIYVEIGFQAKLEYPVPGVVERSLQDRQCSDLYLLNATQDLKDFEIDLSVERQQARIAVRQAWPEFTPKLEPAYQ